MSDHLRILLIDDEQPFHRLLSVALDQEMVLRSAYDGANGLRMAAMEPPDLVLLDLGLPDRDGCSVLQDLRAWSSVPVIVLSARDQEAEKIRALDHGADDYLTKPFGVGELLARIRAALRRHQQNEVASGSARVLIGPLDLDLAARSVRIDGEAVDLTATEYRVLAFLVRHRGQVLTHRQLLEEVWGRVEGEDAVHTLRVFMATLRRKLREPPARPRLIRTERGVGYRLIDPER